MGGTAWAELWPNATGMLLLYLAAGLSSGLRLTIARASRTAPASGEASPHGERHRIVSTRRARILGALLIGNVVLNVAGTVLATRFVAVELGGRGALRTIAGLSVLVIVIEALARLAVARGLVERALRAVGIRIDLYGKALSASDEIRGRVDLLHQQGGVVKQERDMLGGLLDLKDLTVSEVMVHRTKMRMLDASLPTAELVAEVLASPYTRLPVFRDDPENIVGVLHARDLLRAIGSGREELAAPLDPERIATPPWFVPDTTTLPDQLGAFLARKQHFALVVDEYGALMGLVTLEDILEEIVGEISDEHDVAARGIRPQPDGSVLVDGSVPIRDVNRTTGWTLPDDEATTVAGLVIHEAMAIPEAGQVFNFHGFRFEVLRRVRNRITALRIARAPVAPDARGAVPGPA